MLNPIRSSIRRLGITISFGSLAACGTASSGRTVPELEYRIIDLMPRYWAFRDSTAGDSASQRAAAFRRMVIAPESRFYEQVFGLPDDARLAQYLGRMERFDSVMRRVTDEFRAAVPQGWSKLRSAFPDLTPGVRIYLVPSLFNSNGQVRYLDDSLVVMLGPDVQAYVEVAIDSGRRTDPVPIVVHELAHYHHWRVNPEIAGAAKSFFKPGAYSAIYYNLWSEGFATYLARVLNPQVPLIGIIGPGYDPVAGPKLVPLLAREFLGKLESTSADDVRDLFYLSGRRKDIPLRSAYHVGYLVAERLARRHSAAELARLDGVRLRDAVRGELEAMAREPAR
jgi:hypothetical protein